MKVLQQVSRGGKRRLVLVLDRSLVNNTVNLLWVAVAFAGRALPLGWVEAGHEGSSDLALQQELLRSRVVVCAVGDGGRGDGGSGVSLHSFGDLDHPKIAVALHPAVPGGDVD